MKFSEFFKNIVNFYKNDFFLTNQLHHLKKKAQEQALGDESQNNVKADRKFPKFNSGIEVHNKKLT